MAMKIAGYSHSLYVFLYHFRPFNRIFRIWYNTTSVILDQRHICQNLNQYGHGKGTIHGAFGVAHQGVEKLMPKNETVLVQGCGAIGLYAIALCKYFGSKTIIATDIVDSKLQIAKSIGADIVINGKTENLKEEVLKLTNNDGVGCLLEASGAQPLLNNCFQLLRKGGTIVLIGLPKTPLHVENVGKDVLFKSLTMHTIHGRKIFSTWEKCEQILFNKSIYITSTISHRFSMSDHEEAFKTLFSGKACKIIIDPQL